MAREMNQMVNAIQVGSLLGLDGWADLLCYLPDDYFDLTAAQQDQVMLGILTSINDGELDPRVLADGASVECAQLVGE